jgi:hypothetical protein
MINLPKYCHAIIATPLSKEVKTALIQHAQKSAQFGATTSYGVVNTTNSTCVSFIPDIKKYIKEHGMPRPVVIVDLPENTLNEVSSWADANNLSGSSWKLQIIRGKSFVAPHVDNTALRKTNKIYLLQAGGPRVVTSWWQLKQEYSKCKVPLTTAIPTTALDLICSAHLQEDCMYDIDVGTIHNVSYMEDDRVSLFAC